VAVDRERLVEVCKHGTTSYMKFGEVPGFLLISQHLKKDYTP